MATLPKEYRGRLPQMPDQYTKSRFTEVGLPVRTVTHNLNQTKSYLTLAWSHRAGASRRLEVEYPYHAGASHRLEVECPYHAGASHRQNVHIMRGHATD